jgi:hypothetical protein
MCADSWRIIKRIWHGKQYLCGSIFALADGEVLDPCININWESVDIDKLPENAFCVFHPVDLTDLTPATQGNTASRWPVLYDAEFLRDFQTFEQVYLAACMLKSFGMAWDGNSWREGSGRAGDDTSLRQKWQQEVERALSNRGSHVSLETPQDEFFFCSALVERAYSGRAKFESVCDYLLNIRTMLGATVMSAMGHADDAKCFDENLKYDQMGLDFDWEICAESVPIIARRLFRHEPTPDLPHFRKHMVIVREKKGCWEITVGKLQIARVDGQNLVILRNSIPAGFAEAVMGEYAKTIGAEIDASRTRAFLNDVWGLSDAAPFVVIPLSRRVVEPNIAELAISAENEGRRNMCLDMLTQYPEIIEVPENMRERVAKMTLSRDLDKGARPMQ